MKRIKNLFKTSIGVSILWVWEHIPKNRFTSNDIEKKISECSEYKDFQEGIIYNISGTYTRYFASPNEYPSTLAVAASKKAILDTGISINEIDCIIFASASQDITEPATANIIQHALGSNAPVFDIKNACNSFLNGMQVAKSFIESWQYKNILICSGETPSRAIKWNPKNREEFKNSLASYNLWDAWVAMVLWEEKKNKPVVSFTEFYSKWIYFDASTISGWGSRFPRDLEKTYFISDSKRLSEAFGQDAKTFLFYVLQKYNWRLSWIKYFFPHLVSRYSSEVFRESFGVLGHYIRNHNTTHGNIVSCSVPYALIRAIEEKKFSPWERWLLVGLAAGASFSLVGIQF